MSSLRIGVDVGGTNTDGVLLDPFSVGAANRGILAWHKAATTANPSLGIENAISQLLTMAKVDTSAIASVTIGTTHFINAVIEKDQNRLSPVAVIRLCGPFSHDMYPGIDWPTDLRNIICKHVGFVDGGVEIDGDPISEISEAQIAEQCRQIKAKGIRSIVVNGVFSPADMTQQEERVAALVSKHYPEADVVISKQVANLGFLERENAAILNAAILSFAQKTLRAFQQAIARLKLSCPVFITQNDGTILPAHLAAKLPIRTFNSGPTNSICGAAFLVRNEALPESMVVVDIGGTSTDVGMLLGSGLPRQAAAVTEVCGVRMNFSCPDVKSIGLGGGSIVRKTQATETSPSVLTVGPDSVGHDIQTQALVFGGDVHTATDYAVVASKLTDIGKPDLVAAASLDDSTVEQYKMAVTQMLEAIIDKSKTSAEDITVLLVGGGALIAPDVLKGASKVIKPQYSSVANAIGAAIARVSGTVDTVVSTQDKTSKQILDEVALSAFDQAVKNGAIRDTVVIVEMDLIPLQYVAHKARVIVKAIGDFDFARPSVADTDALSLSETTLDHLTDKKPLQGGSDVDSMTALDIEAYKPKVTAQREWIVSETDLEWISTGCYILGTGGGGTPYPHFIRVRELLRNGATVRVISPDDVRDEDQVACGGGMGSPTVVIEKLAANEMMEAQEAVYSHVGFQPNSILAFEIGGGNGLQSLFLGASTNMNIPAVDGDWMGCAYPTSWQITPVVHGGDGALFLPTAIADGNGHTILMLRSNSEKMVERALRAALTEMGSAVACAKGPCLGSNMKSWVVKHTVSLAWRIGRAVALCRAQNNIEHVSEAIIDQVGGPSSAKVLFKGKIVAVERKTAAGHVYGELVIAASDVGTSGRQEFTGQLKIPFKNENIIATAVDENGAETTVATVPDLICVCDASSGEAIGTPEYRYGLLVVVIGITASDHWTSTARGIELGGPKAFGWDIPHKPLGAFSKPRSVIDEYQPA